MWAAIQAPDRTDVQAVYQVQMAMQHQDESTTEDDLELVVAIVVLAKPHNVDPIGQRELQVEVREWRFQSRGA